tara:strand:+ start:289 stop:1110 length:822 start_codon:yes stop_codon:yes gene_type:complete
MSRPFISLITATYNRREFFPNIIRCVLAQTYPLHRMEWVIIDDGQDCIEDLIKPYLEDNKKNKGLKFRYYYSKDKIKLGRKRNMLNEHAKGDIIVCLDDDDFYPPVRVSHAVTQLEKKKKFLIAGCSTLHCYYNHVKEIYQYGPYGPYHGTNATFAYRKEYLKNHHYEDHAEQAEEAFFTNKFSEPLIQLDPYKTMLCIVHNHNTFDKVDILGNPQFKSKLCNHKLKNFVKDKKLRDFYTAIKIKENKEERGNKVMEKRIKELQEKENTEGSK